MNSVIIEIVKHPYSFVKKEEIFKACEEYLKTIDVVRGQVVSITDTEDTELAKVVSCIIIDDDDGTSEKLDLYNSQITWYMYALNDTSGNNDIQASGDGEEQIIMSTNWTLPSLDFHGLWENLIYDTTIKEHLFRYSQTVMLFSEKGVDQNIIGANKVILLHGPPGTGKTSLCKALSQKLAIRMNHRFDRAQLVEINSHSLFSKWFSESGKLVTKLFTRINEMIEDPKMLICVLLDEVESLAHARSQCMSGNEPSDSIRVVNAVLTQIDQIKRFPNVLILTTSNVTGAIDVAFVDRADIKQFVGLPSPFAIYQIYYSCLQELMRTNVIVPHDVVLPVSVVKGTDVENNCICQRTRELWIICLRSKGLSGRSIRKVPLIAKALFTRDDQMTLATFLIAMLKSVDHVNEQRAYFPDN